MSKKACVVARPVDFVQPGDVFRLIKHDGILCHLSTQHVSAEAFLDLGVQGVDHQTSFRQLFLGSRPTPTLVARLEVLSDLLSQLILDGLDLSGQVADLRDFAVVFKVGQHFQKTLKQVWSLTVFDSVRILQSKIFVTRVFST